MDRNNRSSFRLAYGSLLRRVELADPSRKQDVDALWTEYKDLSKELDQHPSLRDNVPLQSLDASVVAALSLKSLQVMAVNARRELGKPTDG